jgi:hypothetical protein
LPLPPPTSMNNTFIPEMSSFIWSRNIEMQGCTSSMLHSQLCSNREHIYPATVLDPSQGHDQGSNTCTKTRPQMIHQALMLTLAPRGKIIANCSRLRCQCACTQYRTGVFSWCDQFNVCTCLHTTQISQEHALHSIGVSRRGSISFDHQAACASRDMHGRGNFNKGPRLPSSLLNEAGISGGGQQRPGGPKQRRRGAVTKSRKEKRRQQREGKKASRFQSQQQRAAQKRGLDHDVHDAKRARVQTQQQPGKQAQPRKPGPLLQAMASIKDAKKNSVKGAAQLPGKSGAAGEAAPSIKPRFNPAKTRYSFGAVCECVSTIAKCPRHASSRVSTGLKLTNIAMVCHDDALS